MTDSRWFTCCPLWPPQQTSSAPLPPSSHPHPQPKLTRELSWTCLVVGNLCCLLPLFLKAFSPCLLIPYVVARTSTLLPFFFKKKKDFLVLFRFSLVLMAVFKNNSRMKLPDWFPVGKNRVTCLKGVCVGLFLTNVSHLRLTCTAFVYEFHLFPSDWWLCLASPARSPRLTVYPFFTLTLRSERLNLIWPARVRRRRRHGSSGCPCRSCCPRRWAHVR